MIELSFCLFLAIFIGIGLLSARKSKGNTADYLLAGSSVKPWLVALSAVATNNSGYMFIGMIGFTYTSGLSSIWLMIGWIFGDFVASMFIHKKLRMATGKRKLLSFGGAISFWHGEDLKSCASLWVSLLLYSYVCMLLLNLRQAVRHYTFFLAGIIVQELSLVQSWYFSTAWRVELELPSGPMLLNHSL